jgi:hypothetical protein
VLRRSISLLTVLAAALVLAAPAAALAFRVRVEGKTQTIYGATEPRLAATGNPSALDALELASVAGEFFYNLQQSAFGPYVDRIGRYPAAGTAGWVVKVNGVSPPVGADQVVLREGDRVLWYWAQFGVVPGGPETLVLRRTGRSCYRVTAQNDQGRERVAQGAVLSVDGRRFRTRAGRACLPRHAGFVRATLAGAVRSNAVR